MAPPKGVSGNPNGRPPKNRALTEILEKAGAVGLDVNGQRVSGKRLLASLLWEGATTRRVTFPGGEVCTLGIDDWLGLAKFIYQQVDGPPKQNLELAGPGGEPFQHVIKVTLGTPTDD